MVIIWVMNIVLLCILATSSWYLLLLLGPYSVLYCAHFCMKCSLGISNFLEEISSLSHSIVFLCFFALIAEEGFLISPCYSLELCIQMGVSFLFSFAFCFSSFHIPEWSSGFPHFLQFKSEFGNKEFTIWATVSSWSCFCWLERASVIAKSVIGQNKDIFKLKKIFSFH